MAIVLNGVTYNWAGFDQSGTSRWTATADGVASAFSNLTARVTVGTMTKSSSTSSKVRWRISKPVIATADSDCACVGTVLRTAYVDIAADFAATATLAERQAVLAEIQALVLKTEFTGSITALTQPAG